MMMHRLDGSFAFALEVSRYTGDMLQKREASYPPRQLMEKHACVFVQVESPESRRKRSDNTLPTNLAPVGVPGRSVSSWDPLSGAVATWERG